MSLLLYVTASFILFILSYPVWLSFFAPIKYNRDKPVEEVSMILLSYNGGKDVSVKLKHLIQGLRKYKLWELIIVDNDSDEETKAALTVETNENIRIIYRDKNYGIANAMNLGVSLAKYKYLIFCDQRQSLSQANFDHLLSPLLNDEIGAVTSKISARDKDGNYSYLRSYENFIKKQESRIGSVMGVYGPLFSLKKELYRELPEHILLDDLYLSLNILHTQRIIMTEDLSVIDDNLKLLYDTKRANRYLLGLFQLCREPRLINRLTFRRKVFFFWHKYLRLAIPSLAILGLLLLGFNCISGEYEFYYPLLIVLVVFMSKEVRWNAISAIVINVNYLKAFMSLRKKV
jgi:glycosyltransferase involved in cell wall biosynthesis